MEKLKTQLYYCSVLNQIVEREPKYINIGTWASLYQYKTL